MEKLFKLNSVAFLLLFGLFSICSDSKACGPMDVYLTPAGIDCSLSPKPLATVTIGYNACMAAHCDGDIDYLVEVLVGTTVIHSYSTINLVSTFSPCMVFRLGEDECQYYKVRVTMRCNGYSLFMAFENVEGLRQVCNPAP